MRPALAACVVAVAFLLAASAQTVSKDQASMEVATPQLETSCMNLAVAALQDAVDPQQAERQDWNLKRAEAYRELAQLGQSCGA